MVTEKAAEIASAMAEKHPDLHIDVHVPVASVDKSALTEPRSESAFPLLLGRHLKYQAFYLDNEQLVFGKLDADGNVVKAEPSDIGVVELIGFVEFSEIKFVDIGSKKKSILVTRSVGITPVYRAELIRLILQGAAEKDNILFLPFDPDLIDEIQKRLTFEIANYDDDAQSLMTTLREIQGQTSGPTPRSSYSSDRVEVVNVIETTSAGHLYLPYAPLSGQEDARCISTLEKDDARERRVPIDSGVPPRWADMLILTRARIRTDDAGEMETMVGTAATSTPVLALQRQKIDEGTEAPKRTDSRFTLALTTGDTIVNSVAERFSEEIERQAKSINTDISPSADDICEVIDRASHRDALRQNIYRVAAVPFKKELMVRVPPPPRTTRASSATPPLLPLVEDISFPCRRAPSGNMPSFKQKKLSDTERRTTRRDGRISFAEFCSEYNKEDIPREEQLDPDGCTFYVVKVQDTKLIAEFKIVGEGGTIRLDAAGGETIYPKHLKEALKRLPIAYIEALFDAPNVTDPFYDEVIVKHGMTAASFRFEDTVVHPTDLMLLQLKERQELRGIAFLRRIHDLDLLNVDERLKSEKLFELFLLSCDKDARVDSPINVDAALTKMGVDIRRVKNVQYAIRSAIIGVLNAQSNHATCISKSGTVDLDVSLNGQLVAPDVSRPVSDGGGWSLVALSDSMAQVYDHQSSQDLARKPVLFSNTVYRIISVIVQSTFVEILLSNGETVALPRTPVFSRDSRSYHGELGPLPLELLDDRVRCEDVDRLRVRVAFPPGVDRVDAPTGTLEVDPILDGDSPWVLHADPGGPGQGVHLSVTAVGQSEPVSYALPESHLGESALRELREDPSKLLVIELQGGDHPPGTATAHVDSIDALPFLEASESGRRFLLNQRLPENTTDSFGAGGARLRIEVKPASGGDDVQDGGAEDDDTCGGARGAGDNIEGGFIVDVALDAPCSTPLQVALSLQEKLRAALVDKPDYRNASVDTMNGDELLVKIELRNTGKSARRVQACFGPRYPRRMRELESPNPGDHLDATTTHTYIFSSVSMAMLDAWRVPSIDRRILIRCEDGQIVSGGVCLIRCAVVGSEESGTLRLIEGHRAMQPLTDMARAHPRSLVAPEGRSFARNTIADRGNFMIIREAQKGELAVAGLSAAQSFANDSTLHTPGGVFYNCGYDLVPVSCDESQAIRDYSDLQVASSKGTVDGLDVDDAPPFAFEFMRMPSMNQSTLSECVERLDSTARRIAYTAPHLLHPVTAAETATAARRSTAAAETPLTVAGSGTTTFESALRDKRRALDPSSDGTIRWKRVQTPPSWATPLEDDELARRLIALEAEGKPLALPDDETTRVRPWHVVSSSSSETNGLRWTKGSTRGTKLENADLLGAQLDHKTRFTAAEWNQLRVDGTGLRASHYVKSTSGSSFHPARAYFVPTDAPRTLEDRVPARSGLIHEVVDPRLWRLARPHEVAGAFELSMPASQVECVRKKRACFAEHDGDADLHDAAYFRHEGKFYVTRSLSRDKRLAGYTFVLTGCQPVRNLDRHIEACGGRVVSSLGRHQDARLVLVRGYDPCDVWRWSKELGHHAVSDYPGLITRSAAFAYALSRPNDEVLVIDAFDLWRAMGDPNSGLAYALAALADYVKVREDKRGSEDEAEMRRIFQGRLLDPDDVEGLVQEACELLRSNPEDDAQLKFAAVAAIVPSDALRPLAGYGTNPCVRDEHHPAVGDLLPIYGVGSALALRLSATPFSRLARRFMTETTPRVDAEEVKLDALGGAPMKLASIQHFPHARDVDPRRHGARMTYDTVKSFEDATFAVDDFLPKHVEHDILGSFARKQPTCGDIDVLLKIKRNVDEGDSALHARFEEACSKLAMSRGTGVRLDGKARRIEAVHQLERVEDKATLSDADRRSLEFYTYVGDGARRQARDDIFGNRFVIDVDGEWNVLAPTDLNALRRLCASTDTILRRRKDDDSHELFWNRQSGAPGLRIVFFDQGPQVRHAIVLIDSVFRRLDIRWAEADTSAHACMQLYFTGSKRFNQEMRAHAKRRGFRLNERSLVFNGEEVAVKSERDVFDRISFRYTPPEDRQRDGNPQKSTGPDDPPYAGVGRAGAASHEPAYGGVDGTAGAEIQSELLQVHLVHDGSVKSFELEPWFKDMPFTINELKENIREILEEDSLWRVFFFNERSWREAVVALKAASSGSDADLRACIDRIDEKDEDDLDLSVEDLQFDVDDSRVVHAKFRFASIVQEKSASASASESFAQSEVDEAWLLRTDVRAHPSSITKVEYNPVDRYVHVGIGTTFTFPTNAPGLRIRVGKTHCVEWVARQVCASRSLDVSHAREKMRSALALSASEDLDFDVSIDRIVQVDLGDRTPEARCVECPSCFAVRSDEGSTRLFLFASTFSRNPVFKEGVQYTTTFIESLTIAQLRVFAREDAEEPPLSVSAHQIFGKATESSDDAIASGPEIVFVKRMPIRTPTVCVDNVVIPRPMHTPQGSIGKADVGRRIDIRDGKLYIDGHLRVAKWVGERPEDSSAIILSVQAHPGGQVVCSGMTEPIANPTRTMRASNQTMIRWYESLARLTHPVPP